MSEPTDRVHEVQDNAGGAFESKLPNTADIVKEQTRKRIDRQNATWRQQQASLRREKQIGCCILIMGAFLAVCVLVAQLYGAWKR